MVPIVWSKANTFKLNFWITTPRTAEAALSQILLPREFWELHSKNTDIHYSKIDKKPKSKTSLQHPAKVCE